VLAGLLSLAGCSSYQRTYDQTTQRLEQQAQADNQEQTRLHAQAQRYAAVVYFPVGGDVVSADGQRELNWFVQQMQPYPQATFNVQGFTDNTGSEAGNQALGQQRAANVAAYLNAQGVETSRMQVTGFGQSDPAGSNTSGQGRRDNRRVEVTVR
jgi:outer membrane protein OmpA-like peptidoglycan-associated protein